MRHSKRSGPEFIVPNSSGGRGIYVLPWPGVLDLCRPTIHDRVLVKRISSLGRIDPANLRGCAQDVALEGYAGRKAADAAEVTRKTDRSRFVLTQSLLLTALIEDIEQANRETGEYPDRVPDFENHAGLILRRIAPASGCSPDHLTAVLATMAAAFATTGIGREEHTARIPRLINLLTETRVDIADWLLDNPESELEPLGRAMILTMTGALGGAEAMLAQTRATLADPAKLLQSWIANLENAAAVAARCDWLLDGWELLCLIWKIAETEASRRAALLEMAQMLAVWPREVNDWFPGPIPPEAMNLGCKVVSRNDGWRSGAAALAMIERNETLRAMST